jgi:anti-anti-sigma factor
VQITKDTKDGVATLTFSGRMVFDQTLLALRDEIGAYLDSGVTRFVFDVSAVPHCDSAGCGEMIGIYTNVRKAGGAVAVVNPTERVRTLWSRIKLTDVLPIFDRMDEAEAYVRRS